MKKIELIAIDTIVMGDAGKDTVQAEKTFSTDEKTALRLIACGAAVLANPDSLKLEQGVIDAAGSAADAEAQAVLEASRNAGRDAKIEADKEKEKAKSKAQAKAAADAKAKTEAEEKSRQEAEQKAREDEEERQRQQGGAGSEPDLLSGNNETQQ